MAKFKVQIPKNLKKLVEQNLNHFEKKMVKHLFLSLREGLSEVLWYR
jgi:hypothetical protein